MVTRVGHGGACCGAGHLYGFSDAENRDPDLIDRALALSPTGRHNNVMLNRTQMQTLPNVLQRLADRGFVLDGHFINDNHGSHVFSFSRCDKRLKITREALEAEGINWPGMILTPDLHGNMPALPAGVNVQATGATHPDVGSIWRCISNLTGRTGVGLASFTRGAEYEVTRVSHGYTRTYEMAVFSLRPVGTQGTGIYAYRRAFELVREAPEPVAPVVIPEMRHRTDEGTAPVNRITVVASLYANCYRTTGRSHARYGSIQAAQNNQSARARGVTVDRLDIMSDGTEIWVEGVDE